MPTALHTQTRPGVIRCALPFKGGECVSKRLLDETERLRRSNRRHSGVQFRPAACHDGVGNIEVPTRDIWSVDPG